MAAIDAKALLASGLKLQHKRIVNDLMALPPEERGRSHAGCARSPYYMIAECAWVNGWIAELIETGSSNRLTQAEEDARYGSVDSTEKAVAMLDESVNRLLLAYESLDESTLGDITDKPFGRPAPRFQAISLPIHHLAYHDGQLNYLQTLLGDGEIHW